MPDWYDHTGFPSTGLAALSATVRAELALIETSFAKCPTLAGNANNVVMINGSGTAMVATGLVSPTLTTPDITTPTISGIMNTSGGQLLFPSPSAFLFSSDALTLDVYEEGSWTPSLGGTTTYTSRTGRYVRIGRQVFVSARIVVNVIGTGSKHVISGLPFTSANFLFSSWAVGKTASLATSVVSISGVCGAFTSSIQLVSRSVADAFDSVFDLFGNGTELNISGCYEAHFS